MGNFCETGIIHKKDRQGCLTVFSLLIIESIPFVIRNPCPAQPPHKVKHLQDAYSEYFAGTG
jgi:hypothetical protein